MKITRREVIGMGLGAVCASALAACTPAFRSGKPLPRLYRTEEPDELLAVARAIVGLHVYTTFVTVDRDGMPRARPMAINMTSNELKFWMSTRPDSRKLQQIIGNNQATVNFIDPEQWGYVSFMGDARAHADTETVGAQAFLPEDLQRRLFPDFPDDMVMIEFRPRWLEVAGRDIGVHPETWQPQGLWVE